LANQFSNHYSEQRVSSVVLGSVASEMSERSGGSRSLWLSCV